MSQLTEQIIKKVMPLASRQNIIASTPHLYTTALHYTITTATRLQFWLATIAVESGQLQFNSELGTHPEYEYRRDLGNIHKGDGVKFEGHGKIQITGRDAHTAYTEYLRKSKHLPFISFVEFPEKLALEPYSTDAAGWFVNGYKDLNPLADSDNFLAYQIRVNGRNRKTGRPNHWAERVKFLTNAKEAIPADFILTA